jgi:hypothetical protein
MLSKEIRVVVAEDKPEFSFYGNVQAQDFIEGKLVITQHISETKWQTIAVFNANCWKSWRIFEIPSSIKTE